jgi:hypothetical protein
MPLAPSSRTVATAGLDAAVPKALPRLADTGPVLTAAFKAGDMRRHVATALRQRAVPGRYPHTSSF